MKKFITYVDIMHLGGFKKATAQNIIRRAKKNMVQKGYTFYDNRRLGHVPVEAVEEILGSKLLDERE